MPFDLFDLIKLNLSCLLNTQVVSCKVACALDFPKLFLRFMVSYVFSAPWGKHSSTYLIIFASLSSFISVVLLLFSASIFSTIFKSEFLCIFADLQEVETPVVLKDTHSGPPIRVSSASSCIT